MIDFKYATTKDMVNFAFHIDKPETEDKIFEWEEFTKVKKEIDALLVARNNRLEELKDKAILEGLTDAEKEEYKKLKEAN